MLIISLVISCKKKEFPVKNDIPDEAEVPYFKGEINGNPIEIKMDNPDYMNDVSCFKDSLNVFVYQSGLTNNTCNGCNEFIVQLRDNQTSSSVSNGNFSTWMLLGTEINYWNQEEIVKNDTNYVVEFNGWGNKQMLTYTYLFGDGNLSYLQNPTHTYEKNVEYIVRFYTYDPASLQQSMIENKINLNLLKNNFYYFIKLDTIYMAQNLATFSAKNIFYYPNPYLKFYWKIGHNGSYVLGNSTKTIPFITNTLLPISLKVVDGLDTVESNYQLAVNTNTSGNFILTSNFHINNFKLTTSQQLNLFLKKCNMIMKFNGGKIYESKLAGNSNASFKLSVTSIKEIQSPVQGYLAKKIKFNFNSNLVNQTDKFDTLKIRNAEARLIFIYKNSRS